MAPLAQHFVRAIRSAVLALGLFVSLAASSPGFGEEKSPERAPATASQTPSEERFEDPDAILKEFRTKLSALAGRQGVVSPAELAKQAETQKSFAVETLPDPGQRLAPEEIYAKARPSVVIVGGTAWCRTHREWHTSCATGFVLHKQGVIVTNHHVVVAFQEMSAAGVMTEDRRVFPVKSVLAADRQNDVALLKIEADGLAPLPVAASAPVGAAIFCLSHPSLECDGTQNGFYTFTRGMICGKFRVRLGGPAPVNVLAISADYAKGSSGGPILNESGAVVGVVCQTMSVCNAGDTSEVQMTWKFSRPSSSILALVRGAK